MLLVVAPFTFYIGLLPCFSRLSCFPPGLAKKDSKARPMSVYFHFAKTRVPMGYYIYKRMNFILIWSVSNCPTDTKKDGWTSLGHTRCPKEVHPPFFSAYALLKHSKCIGSLQTVISHRPRSNSWPKCKTQAYRFRILSWSHRESPERRSEAWEETGKKLAHISFKVLLPLTNLVKCTQTMKCIQD